MDRFLEEVFHEEPGAGAEAGDQHQSFIEVRMHDCGPATPQGAADCRACQEGESKRPIN